MYLFRSLLVLFITTSVTNCELIKQIEKWVKRFAEGFIKELSVVKSNDTTSAPNVHDRQLQYSRDVDWENIATGTPIWGTIPRFTTRTTWNGGRPRPTSTLPRPTSTLPRPTSTFRRRTTKHRSTSSSSETSSSDSTSWRPNKKPGQCRIVANCGQGNKYLRGKIGTCISYQCAKPACATKLRQRCSFRLIAPRSIAHCSSANCRAACEGNHCTASCKGYQCIADCKGSPCKSQCYSTRCAIVVNGHMRWVDHTRNGDTNVTYELVEEDSSKEENVIQKEVETEEKETVEEETE